MAAMAAEHVPNHATVLDPGAGAGALTEAVLDSFNSPFNIALVERDEVFHEHLVELVDAKAMRYRGEAEVHSADFLELAPRWIKEGRKFTHVVMNPPYQRIRPGDDSAAKLRALGVRTHNLFAAFMWLSVDLLEDDGVLVAVVPRSLLSGLQYAAAREHILERAGVSHLHHFIDRRGVFGRDSVQQEVVVVALVKGRAPLEIQFSYSEGLDDIDGALALPARRFGRGPVDRYVMVVPSPGNLDGQPGETSPLLPPGVSVSVGSVVDFRATADISAVPDAIPLVGSEIFFARRHLRRWLAKNVRTDKHIFPPGNYVVVRRISPTESPRRLQAIHIAAQGEEFAQGVAFENHVLVLHAGGKGLSAAHCRVLLKRLSDPRNDIQFRERGGTNQVNAGDLRALTVVED
ncbi:Eco57I restriction-modification methylase domain-containing protein [Microbacterium sp. YY-03]|uniref:Eco57I restriction-modification methylase domain-containing protein n=1 Tax=Microbacterium sp. YY-03 TaxID=3421636 RepID=UPI003D172633